MSSASIRARIAAGLSRAVKRTGSDDIDLVYLITTTSTGTATTIGTVTENTPALLKDAVFTAYAVNLIGANIQVGDRELISQYDVVIPTGSTIRQGSTDYIVMGPSPVAPTSDNLLYKTQVRVK
jgi:hypothetical protein